MARAGVWGFEGIWASEGIWPFEEEIDDRLDLVPIAGRRALDRAGLHLSLEGWRSLSLDDRRAIVALGVADQVDAGAVSAIVGRSAIPARAIEPVPELAADRMPELVARTELGAAIEARWAGLRPIERFALLHSARSAEKRGQPERLARAVRAILG